MWFSRRVWVTDPRHSEHMSDQMCYLYHSTRLWGCPRTILSDNRLKFCSKLSQAVCQLLGVRKLVTSSYHPNCNRGVERVNHNFA